MNGRRIWCHASCFRFRYKGSGVACPQGFREPDPTTFIPLTVRSNEAPGRPRQDATAAIFDLGHLSTEEWTVAIPSEMPLHHHRASGNGRIELEPAFRHQYHGGIYIRVVGCYRFSLWHFVRCSNIAIVRGVRSEEARESVSKQIR